jgi:hypothetical protein
MVREKGTLNNFMADGAISRESVLWLLRSGKVPIGQERTRLIEREQLKKWGVLIEGPVPALTTRPAAKPKVKKAGTDKEEVMQIV